jgi:hypothetical protein
MIEMKLDQNIPRRDSGASCAAVASFRCILGKREKKLHLLVSTDSSNSISSDFFFILLFNSLLALFALEIRSHLCFIAFCLCFCIQEENFYETDVQYVL